VTINRPFEDNSSQSFRPGVHLL